MIRPAGQCPNELESLVVYAHQRDGLADFDHFRRGCMLLLHGVNNNNCDYARAEWTRKDGFFSRSMAHNFSWYSSSMGSFLSILFSITKFHTFEE